MADIFEQLFGKGAAARARIEFAPDLPRKPAAELEREETAILDGAGGRGLSPFQYRIQDGEKFAGGFGPTQLLLADYWTLRARSVELFEKNLYARGLIRRLVTNVINVGLYLEAQPEEQILGFAEDELADWAETTETRFSLWANEPEVCDFAERQTFGAIQAQAYLEALIAGDVLVTLQQDQRTKMPRIKLISGSAVQTPLAGATGRLPSGVKICHGVELDANGRHLAYWIRQEDGTSKRLPAWGEKSGRRLAWLVYGSDKRLDDVRGKPILSLILQSLKEIDRYRDAIQRKAVINSIVAMYIQKDVAKPGTRAMARNGLRRGQDTAVDTTGKARSYNTAEHIPGLVLDELQVGEEPKAFTSTGTTEAFGVFEEAIIQAIAWCFQIPPEILTLAFSSNYSASQAASAEFKMFLNKEQTTFGDCFCQPIYCDWLISAVLAEKVPAKGFLEAWRSPGQFDIYSAWLCSDWAGQIKPAIDALKLVTAGAAAVAEGFVTRGRIAREIYGLKYRKVIAQNKRDNILLAEANKPLAELEAMSRPQPLPPGGAGDKPPAKAPAKAPAKPTTKPPVKAELEDGDDTDTDVEDEASDGTTALGLRRRKAAEQDHDVADQS